MIQNGLLQVALCTQFLTGTVLENTLPPEEYVENNEELQNIQISVDGELSQGDLIVNEDTPIEITSQGQTVIKAVYVDGEYKENTSSLMVGPDNEVVAVETEQGESYVYPVKAVEMVEASFSTGNGDYSIDSNPELIFNEAVNEPVNAILLQDGNPIQSVSCQNRNEIQLHLDETGTYGLYLEYERYSFLKGKINGEKEIQFHYSEKEPTVSIQEKRDEKGVEIQVHGDGDNLNRKVITVENGEALQEYDFSEPIVLPVVEGEHKIYQVHARVEDAYGRKAEDSLQVEIDRKPPVILASFNDIPLQDNQETMISDLSHFTYDIEDAVYSDLSVYINDQYVSNSLSGVTPSSKDRIKIVITAKDEHQNEAVHHYLLRMQDYIPYVPEPEIKPIEEEVKEKKPETTTSLQIPVLNRSNDYVEVVQDWGIDENQTVELKHEKRSIVDHTKPFICLVYPDNSSGEELHAGDKARLTILNTVDYSNDCFSKIIINGEKIDVDTLSRDELNNQYWEFELKEGVNTIEAEAKDDSLNTTVFNESVHAKKNNSFPWIGLSAAALLGSILIWIKKHVESMDS